MEEIRPSPVDTLVNITLFMWFYISHRWCPPIFPPTVQIHHKGASNIFQPLPTWIYLIPPIDLNTLKTFSQLQIEKNTWILPVTSHQVHATLVYWTLWTFFHTCLSWLFHGEPHLLPSPPPGNRSVPPLLDGFPKHRIFASSPAIDFNN